MAALDRMTDPTDQHGSLPKDLPNQCRDMDQPCRALIEDLKRRGMLEDTLVIWGGEFGRTVYCQGKLTKQNYGRDHSPRARRVLAHRWHSQERIVENRPPE